MSHNYLKGLIFLSASTTLYFTGNRMFLTIQKEFAGLTGELYILKKRIATFPDRILAM